MASKDYYKILGVLPTATAQDIKKAYRRLAHQYHPDKNQGSPIAETHFKTIIEAYTIIGNPEKRNIYDNERLRAGLGNYTPNQQEVTPEWLLKICTELNQSLLKMDSTTISYTALKAYILLILSDDHLSILINSKNKDLTTLLVTELITATKKLPVNYTIEITNRLLQLAQSQPDLLAFIISTQATRQKTEAKENRQPYLIIFITLLLCLFMYVYGRLK